MQQIIVSEGRAHFESRVNEQLKNGLWHVVPGTLVMSAVEGVNHLGVRNTWWRYACVLETKGGPAASHD